MSDRSSSFLVLLLWLSLLLISSVSAFTPTATTTSRTTTIRTTAATTTIASTTHRCFQMVNNRNIINNNNVDMNENNSHDQAANKSKFPKLIVLDLDNTMWTPELYQLRKIQRSGGTPVAGRDVTLFPGAQALMDQVRRAKQGDAHSIFPTTTQFAVASRTKSVDWAHDLLTQFQWRELLDHVEIFPGNKVQHFEHLRRDSGFEYQDMMFFDDARDGKYGNCAPVSALGVLSVHCPTGLESSDLWQLALQRYQEWDGRPNTIVEWDGSVTNTATSSATATASGNQQQTGTIKTVNHDKKFGFIQVATAKGNPSKKKRNNNDVFFHFSALPHGIMVQQGDQVQFSVQTDPRNPGKFRAANVQINTNNGDENNNNANDATTISMRAFSMNMPFAALLANGYKTLESRNGTMFKPYAAGTQMLLHVGRRIYPDGNRHLEIMQDHLGNDDAIIEELKSLPPGFDKGQIVAIMELGNTYETTETERSTPELQRRIAAYGRDSGRILTEIAKVQYLKRPVPMAAQGGVFHVNNIPLDALPDDWTLPEGTVAPEAYRVNDNANGSSSSNSNSNDSSASATNKDNKRVIYSISG